jgi:hypothetical protein
MTPHLGRGIIGQADITVVRRDRGHVDDAPTAPFAHFADDQAAEA